jgi:hypothetical protein
MIDCWVGRQNLCLDLTDYWQAYLDLITVLSMDCGLRIPISTKDALLHNTPAIHNAVIPDSFSKYKVLVINSEPKSGQWAHVETLDTLARFIGSDRVITTKPTPGVTSTYPKLDLFQIGKLSQQMDYIIGINTAPLHPCLNPITMSRVKRWWIVDSSPPAGHHFVSPDRKNIVCIRGYGEFAAAKGDIIKESSQS